MDDTFSAFLAGFLFAVVVMFVVLSVNGVQTNKSLFIHGCAEYIQSSGELHWKDTGELVK